MAAMADGRLERAGRVRKAPAWSKLEDATALGATTARKRKVRGQPIAVEASEASEEAGEEAGETPPDGGGKQP